MLRLGDMTGLAGIAFAAASCLILLPGVSKLTGARQGISLVVAFVLFLLPFGTLPIAGYVRGATGDLSITTLVLLGWGVLTPWREAFRVAARQRNGLVWLIGLSAVVFYPMALGWGTVDPYRLGYGNPAFVGALMVLSLLSWYAGFGLISLCITLASIAWTAGWYESDNLWDYLLDPFVSFYGISAILTFAFRACLRPLHGISKASRCEP
jgi:hypothetical protein